MANCHAGVTSPRDDVDRSRRAQPHGRPAQFHRRFLHPLARAAVDSSGVPIGCALAIHAWAMGGSDERQAASSCANLPVRTGAKASGLMSAADCSPAVLRPASPEPLPLTPSKMIRTRLLEQDTRQLSIAEAGVGPFERGRHIVQRYRLFTEANRDQRQRVPRDRPDGAEPASN